MYLQTLFRASELPVEVFWRGEAALSAPTSATLPLGGVSGALIETCVYVLSWGRFRAGRDGNDDQDGLGFMGPNSASECEPAPGLCVAGYLIHRPTARDIFF